MLGFLPYSTAPISSASTVSTFLKIYNTNVRLVASPRAHNTNNLIKASSTKSQYNNAELKTTQFILNTNNSVLRLAGSRSAQNDIFLKANITKTQLADQLLRSTFLKAFTQDTLSIRSSTYSQTVESYKRLTRELSHDTSAIHYAVISKILSSNSFNIAIITQIHNTTIINKLSAAKAYNISHLLLLGSTTSSNNNILLLSTGSTNHNTIIIKKLSVVLSQSTQQHTKATYSLTHSTDILNQRNTLKLNNTNTTIKASANRYSYTNSQYIATVFNIQNIQTYNKATLFKTHTASIHLFDYIKRQKIQVYIQLNNARTHTAYALRIKIQTNNNKTNSLKYSRIIIAQLLYGYLKQKNTLLLTSNNLLTKRITIFSRLLSLRIKTLIKTQNVISLITNSITNSFNTYTLLKKRQSIYQSAKSGLYGTLSRSHTTSARKRALNSKLSITASYLKNRNILNISTIIYKKKLSSKNQYIALYNIANYLRSMSTNTYKKSRNSLVHSISLFRRSFSQRIYQTNVYAIKTIFKNMYINATLRASKIKFLSLNSLVYRLGIVSNTVNIAGIKNILKPHAVDLLKRDSTNLKSKVNTLKKQSPIRTVNTNIATIAQISRSISSSAFIDNDAPNGYFDDSVFADTFWEVSVF